MAGQKQIETLRKVTDIVRPFPFVYTIALLAVCLSEKWLSLKCTEVVELLTFTSVPAAILCWWLSKIIKLCVWYRLQCFVMVLPLAIPICRILWPEFGYAWIGAVVILSLSIVNRCLIDFKDWKKERKTRG